MRKLNFSIRECSPSKQWRGASVNKTANAVCIEDGGVIEWGVRWRRNNFVALVGVGGQRRRAPTMAVFPAIGGDDAGARHFPPFATSEGFNIAQLYLHEYCGKLAAIPATVQGLSVGISGIQGGVQGVQAKRVGV